jgi:hypothetical protein
MANATIGSVTGTQTGNFNVSVSFDVSVMGVEKTDFTLRALLENGITGVDFNIVGTEPNQNFNLNFTLPTNVEGSFEISFTGMVTPQGSTTPEAVMANTVTVFYDTTANVSASLGTVEYRDGGEIAVPVIFGENVIVPSKSVFTVRHVSGDALEGIEYYILGENTAWELIFQIPQDRSGSFRISAVGDVLKVSSKVWDNIIATPKTVVYDTSAPRVINFVSDPVVPGERLTFRIAFNTLTTGWHQNNTVPQIWKETAGHPGTPSSYKWVGTSPPNLDQDVPDDLTTTDWQLLAAPPAGNPTPGMNGFNDDGTEWHGESGQYFMIVYPLIPAGFDEEVILFGPSETLRGPVS